ncbi:MAG: hypothetical protein M0T80_00990 [Actinomycetota bacterium]|nr:hypothetical protein [Actinomycetota bacterium]
MLSGFGAAVAHVGGNRVADYQSVLVYGDPELKGFELAGSEEGTEVLIAVGDPWVGRHGLVTTYAQAWADLLCLPGWQAARFVDELNALTPIIRRLRGEARMVAAGRSWSRPGERIDVARCWPSG